MFSVWAADYTESERRKAYFEQALSGYFKQIVDTDNAVSILEYDQANQSYVFSEPISYLDENGKLVFKDTGKLSYEKDSAGDITATNATEVVNQVVRILEENKITVKEGEKDLYIVETLEKSDTDSNSVNGTKTTIGTDQYQLVSGAVTSLENTLNGLNVSYHYGYNTDGNVTSETMTRTEPGSQGETHVSMEQTVYTYDPKGQLVSAENNTTKWEYTYDTRGNLLSRKEYAVTTNSDGTKSYSEKTAEAASYTYDTVWKDKLVNYQGQSISYDAIGNPTSYLGKTLSWSMGRQLSSIDNISFTYNSDGIRTSKINGSKITKYYLSGTDVIYQTDGTNSLYFYYDGDGNVIGFEYANNLYYYVKNMQGDVVGIADTNGAMQTEYTYDPWGKVLSVTGNETLGNLNPFRYRCYYYDTETALYYLQSRYYDPQVGRFLNSDDVNYIGTTESELSYNPFAYCENDPVNASDPTGTRKLPAFVRRVLKWKKLIKLNKRRSLALGAIGLLISAIGISKDIRNLQRMTKDKLATLLVAAFPYATTYITKDVVATLMKAAVVATIADMVFSFVLSCCTGSIFSVAKTLIAYIGVYFLPPLWKSAQILYYVLKRKKNVIWTLQASGPVFGYY